MNLLLKSCSVSPQLCVIVLLGSIMCSHSRVVSYSVLKFKDYCARYPTKIVNTGRSPGHAVGMAGCGHSKIARVARVVFVFVLYVAVLPSLQFLTVTKTVTLQL